MCHDYVFLNPGYEKNLNPHRAFLRIENRFFYFQHNATFGRGTGVWIFFGPRCPISLSPMGKWRMK